MIFLLVLFFVGHCFADVASALRTIADFNRTLRSDPSDWDAIQKHDFLLEGSLTSVSSASLFLHDATGHTHIPVPDGCPAVKALAAGDHVRVSGQIVFGTLYHVLTPELKNIERIRPGKPPTATAISGIEFASGRYDYQKVSVRGTVLDLVIDEIYPDTAFLLLNCDEERVPCPVAATNASPSTFRKLVGHDIAVTGMCHPAPGMSRRLIGRTLVLTEPYRPCGQGDKDPFAVPELADIRRLQPEQLSTLGRRKLTGRVLAVWRNAALIRTPEDLIARLNFIEPTTPRYGDFIEATGLPETDLYMPILQRAFWRKAKMPAEEFGEPVRDVSFPSIFLDENGRRRLDSRLHGKVIRTKALVRSMPSVEGPVNYMHIGTDDLSIPVDIDSADPRPDGLSVGSEAEITGVCLLDCQSWRPNTPIPPIDSVRIIVRSADDIRILSTPSWWTAGRLLVVVGILGAVLLFVIGWNLALQRVAERRGRKLSDERIARAEAEIKTMERTRLAVELHDTIAQNLTGVSIALDTARQFCQNVRPELAQQIDVADATLDSCQTELRNCLWDLRNQALEETDLNTAIRTALQPHVTDAELDIRFNVDRSRLTENTAHAILRIIRELVINAVRHGHATHIQIAGAIDPDALRFSVRDNGSGFDAENCPGITQKHFGLQGIRERLSLLGGEITIESKHGSGTRVVVAIPLHDYQDPAS